MTFLVLATNETERPTISVDPSTPFDAHEFYAGLRVLNADPGIHQRPDGGFWEYCAVGHLVGDVSELYRWADSGDPDGVSRKVYVFAAWDTRPASELPVEYQFVPLGA
ncbi:hypothetical protein ACVWZV_005651 [Bradyrhizobium sp. GM5.1]